MLCDGMRQRDHGGLVVRHMIEFVMVLSTNSVLACWISSFVVKSVISHQYLFSSAKFAVALTLSVCITFSKSLNDFICFYLQALLHTWGLILSFGQKRAALLSQGWSNVGGLAAVASQSYSSLVKIIIKVSLSTSSSFFILMCSTFQCSYHFIQSKLGIRTKVFDTHIYIGRIHISQHHFIQPHLG
jgi:hypothetical protein